MFRTNQNCNSLSSEVQIHVYKFACHSTTRLTLKSYISIRDCISAVGKWYSSKSIILDGRYSFPLGYDSLYWGNHQYLTALRLTDHMICHFVED